MKEYSLFDQIELFNGNESITVKKTKKKPRKLLKPTEDIIYPEPK